MLKRNNYWKRVKVRRRDCFRIYLFIDYWYFLLIIVIFNLIIVVSQQCIHKCCTFPYIQINSIYILFLLFRYLCKRLLCMFPYILRIIYTKMEFRVFKMTGVCFGMEFVVLFAVNNHK